MHPTCIYVYIYTHIYVCVCAYMVMVSQETPFQIKYTKNYFTFLSDLFSTSEALCEDILTLPEVPWLSTEF